MNDILNGLTNSLLGLQEPFEFLFEQLLEEAEFDIGIVSGEDPRRMQILHQLPAELQIKLVTVLLRAPEDFRRLFREVFPVVKTDSLHSRPLSVIRPKTALYFPLIPA